jgi:hypothetical protein
MNPTDKLMAWAQVIFTGLIFAFVAAIFIIFETGHAHLTIDELKIYERDTGWLKDAALVVLYFWFQRARQGGIPDASQMVTQSHTSPDGTKTTVTSPANAPAASIPTLPTTTAASAAPLAKPPGDKI